MNVTEHHSEIKICKSKMVIAQTLIELHPYGLTRVVTKTNTLIEKLLIKYKKVSATRIPYFDLIETEAPLSIFPCHVSYLDI